MDFASFDKYLEKIATDAYPRSESPQSGALFKKLMDSIEQPALSDAGLDLQARMEMSIQLQANFGNILKRYGTAHLSGGQYEEEIAQLQGGTLTVTPQLMTLVDEFLPTISKDDPTYGIRMKGLDQLKNGVAMVMKGLTVSLAEKRGFSDEQRKTMMEYLLKEGPQILSSLPESFQQEMRVTIRNLLSDEKDQGIKADLEQFLEVTKD